jgi:hypothetical protein
MYREGDPNPERGGRPVAKGEEGSLAIIAQEDFGHKVAVDLFNGVIAIDYDDLNVAEDGRIGLENPKATLWICDETNIAGDLFYLEQEFIPYEDEKGRRFVNNDGSQVTVRNDILTPLIWRPIWFTRITSGVPAKVIGAQTTLPPEFGGKNVKKMITLYHDGRLGID